MWIVILKSADLEESCSSKFGGMENKLFQVLSNNIDEILTQFDR